MFGKGTSPFDFTQKNQYMKNEHKVQFSVQSLKCLHNFHIIT